MKGAAVTAMVVLWAGSALAAPGVGPSLSGTVSMLDTHPGDQTDPHVSGDWVAYTGELNGGSGIRFRNLATDVAGAVPLDGGGMDFLSDLSGSTLLYTHLTQAGSAVFAFNLSTDGPAVELSPRPGSNRRSAAVGGRTVAWQDYGFNAGLLAPEIVVFDSFSRRTTRLTSNAKLDKNPAVSPDGDTVVWTQCQTRSEGCAVWRALYADGSWSSAALTGSEGEASMPDTDGRQVVYASSRPGGRDLYWQTLPSGPEQRLAIAGDDSNPAISGNLIAFEHRDPTSPTPNGDVWLYDLDTEAVYALTDSPVDETLNDISVSTDGLVRVVWTAGEEDYNVYAFSFRMGTRGPASLDGTLRLKGCMSGSRRVLRGSPTVRVDPRTRRLSVSPEPPSLARVQACGEAGGPPSFLTLLLVGRFFLSLLRPPKSRFPRA